MILDWIRTLYVFHRKHFTYYWQDLQKEYGPFPFFQTTAALEVHEVQEVQEETK